MNQWGSLFFNSQIAKKCADTTKKSASIQVDLCNLSGFDQKKDHGVKMKPARIYISIAVIALVGLFGWQLSGREAVEEKSSPASEAQTHPSTGEDATESAAQVPATSPKVADTTAAHLPDAAVTAAVSPDQSAEAPYDDEANIDSLQEFEDLKRELFDEEASAVLPLLSVQTFRYDTAPNNSATNAATADQDQPQALSTDKSGPYGHLAPPDGHVWIRIDPAYAQEHKDIMAQAADLYRVETGTSDPVTVMLWVGGRPYRKQVYPGS